MIINGNEIQAHFQTWQKTIGVTNVGTRLILL